MSIFLGSIDDTGRGNPRIADVDKFITPKLVKLERAISKYFYDRMQGVWSKNYSEYKQMQMQEKVMNQRGYRDLERKWEQEIESIQRKNGFIVGHIYWAYNIGDVLA